MGTIDPVEPGIERTRCRLRRQLSALLLAAVAAAGCTDDDEAVQPGIADTTSTAPAEAPTNTVATATSEVGPGTSDEDCGSFDVARSRASDSGPLIAGYACLRAAFEDGRRARIGLLFTSADGERIPTTYWTREGTVIVASHHRGGVERERCAALEGDDDGSVFPAECEPEGCPTGGVEATSAGDRDAAVAAVEAELAGIAPDLEVVAAYRAQSPAPEDAAFAALPRSQCGERIAAGTWVVETHMPSFGDGPSLTDVQWFVARIDGEWVVWGSY